MGFNSQQVDVGYKSAYCPDINPNVVLLFKQTKLITTLMIEIDIGGRRRKILNMITNDIVSKNTLKKMLRMEKCNHSTYAAVLSWLFFNLRYLYDLLGIETVKVEGLKISREDFSRRKQMGDDLFFYENNNGMFVFKENSFIKYNNTDMITCLLNSLENKTYINKKENRYE